MYKRQLRALFVTLILDGAPAPKLWSEFKESLIEDLKITRNIEEAIIEALCEIDLKLQMHGKSNTQVNLPACEKHSILRNVPHMRIFMHPTLPPNSAKFTLLL